MTPTPRCLTPGELLGGRGVFGLWANLYSLRGRAGLGVGNLSDLCELVEWAGGAGAAFVGISPLHALRNRGDEISPYQPISRLFRNPLYLDPRAVPEFADCRPAREALDAGAGRREQEALRAAPRIDYGRVAALLRPALEALHGAFAARCQAGEGGRARAYADYRSRQGKPLHGFATFCALEEHLAGRGLARDWRCWPEALRQPNSGAVAEFAGAHPREVDFHAFLQFELDRQLAGVARAARGAGLAIGLYQDLALGSSATGFDTWAFPDLFVPEVSVGAPPDAYSPTGQDWGFPPVDPERLAADGYGYWKLLLRAGFAHAGALRIDHALGLFRQFWVPAGASPGEGVYRHYPSRELLTVLAEESRRAGALVIGEDLGVPLPTMAPALARFGVLSSRVMMFERTPAGGFRAASRYSRRALVTANTHDLLPLAGFWRGRDLELRGELGLLPGEALVRAQAERERERRALLRRLAADGALDAAREPDSPAGLCAAVHAFLCRTPAPLVGLSLDDLAGESEPVNLPGVGPERFSSWTRRMGASLEALSRDGETARALAGAARRGACAA